MIIMTQACYCNFRATKKVSFEEVYDEIGLNMIILISISCVVALAIMITIIACCCCCKDSEEVTELKVKYNSISRANSLNRSASAYSKISA